MKICGGCGTKYEGDLLKFFYKDDECEDGFMRNCKACRRSASTKYRMSNADAIRAKKRERYNDPNKEDSRKRYLKSEVGKAKLKMSQKKWQESNPERYATYSKVKWAIQKGTLQRKPCEVCNHPKAAFYHKDYSKPLEVYWRCFRHKNIVDSHFSACLNEATNINRNSQENTR